MNCNNCEKLKMAEDDIVELTLENYSLSMENEELKFANKDLLRKLEESKNGNS